MTERKTKNYDFSFCLPFWGALSEDQRNLLRRNTIVRSYRAGDSVEFTMPEKNGLFMVLEGALRVYIAVASGREITLMIQHPGSCCYLLTLDSAHSAGELRLGIRLYQHRLPGAAESGCAGNHAVSGAHRGR